MFHVIEKEMAWRTSQGRPEGFDLLKRNKPLIAVGAKEPLGEQVLMADYFRMITILGVETKRQNLMTVRQMVLMAWETSMRL